MTGIIYTLPSIAVFFLLLPLTGRGNLTAIVALVAYSLLIIFRNVTDHFADTCCSYLPKHHYPQNPILYKEQF